MSFTIRKWCYIIAMKVTEISVCAITYLVQFLTWLFDILFYPFYYFFPLTAVPRQIILLLILDGFVSWREWTERTQPWFDIDEPSRGIYVDVRKV
jgi:hypothetical protein